MGDVAGGAFAILIGLGLVVATWKNLTTKSTLQAGGADGATTDEGANRRSLPALARR